MAASRKHKVKHKKNKPIIAPDIERQINTEKKIINIHDNPISYDDCTPSWSFKRMLREKQWTFKPEELICHDDGTCIHPNCVLSKLASYETMTWREIKQKTYGPKNKTCNHFITDLSNLHRDAQRRLQSLQITENFFSLRLEGKVRIYGLLQSRVFEILWYDNKHEIYPLDD